MLQSALGEDLFHDAKLVVFVKRRGLRLGMGLSKHGPLSKADLIGLDTCLNILKGRVRRCTIEL